MCASPTRPPAEAGGTAANGASRGKHEALRGTVLFVHGLWMNGAESFLLKRHLATHDWNLRVFPYSSLAEPMSRIASRCARYALQLARRTLAPVHLVGHSLGGLVIYRMFETGLLAPDRFSGDFCRVVFMGTPIQGSQSGRAMARVAPLRALLGSAGVHELAQDLAQEQAQERGQAPPRRWEHKAQLGVIAGNSPHGLGRLLTRLPGPNDGTVAVAETRIEGATDYCVVHASHTGLLVATEAAQQIAGFLENGRFSV
ncbi:MAG: alpha/beta fold hydrolase [Pseudomonadota bacterium]